MIYQTIRFPKKDRLLSFLAPAALIFNVTICEAHKEPVHEKIATAAVESSDGLADFANETLGKVDELIYFRPLEEPVLTAQKPVYWVARGAFNQDYWPRWGNHFYTVKPIRTNGEVPGLSDKREGFLGKLPHPVTNSFAWATDASIETPELFNILNPRQATPPPTNEDNWAKAREYQLAALTSSLKAERDSKMARMFYSLGHVIHLNQDCAQPDHTRDDAHPFRPYIEKYGKKHYSPQFGAFFPVPPRGWAYWRDQAGFKKLLDFWDRHFYKDGSASALEADATTDAGKLGMAEFSNGNFLGEDSLYSDHLDPSDAHYFPFPSLAHTTEETSEVVLKNKKAGQRGYLKKSGAGIDVTHHSVRKYLAYSPRTQPVPHRSILSINDRNVLQDYHEHLIPKAIEYSAGILDYFFRGKIESAVTWDSSVQKYKIQVTNKSGEAFKNGSFVLYGDDADGNRSPISFATYGYANALNHNASFEATFSLPQPLPKNCVLVYKEGTIGVNGTEALDPVDKDIAIAVKKVALITTASQLPNATGGSPYSKALEQIGLTAPTWQVTAGSLPNGLVLANTGIISGTPTTAGTFNFTVEVQDASGNITVKEFSLSVSFCWENIQDLTWTAVHGPLDDIQISGGSGSFSINGADPESKSIEISAQICCPTAGYPVSVDVTLTGSGTPPVFNSNMTISFVTANGLSTEERNLRFPPYAPVHLTRTLLTSSGTPIKIVISMPMNTGSLNVSGTITVSPLTAP